MHHYQDCGLKNVWLRNGYRKEKSPYGETIAIDDIQGLHKAIALQLLSFGSKLKGTELRFLRKELDMSQKALGALIGIGEQTIALCEKSKQKITKPAERLLRVIATEHIKGNVMVRDLVERINDLDQNTTQKMVFGEHRKQWKYG